MTCNWEIHYIENNDKKVLNVENRKSLDDENAAVILIESLDRVIMDTYEDETSNIFRLRNYGIELDKIIKLEEKK